jgi:hypothetical protein
VTDQPNNLSEQETTNTPTNGVDAPSTETPPTSTTPTTPPAPTAPRDEDAYQERLERLGGEPAPAITPEEFARLQRAGQVHIDARGRVRTTRRSDAEAGVSLRKRRAWYA